MSLDGYIAKENDDLSFLDLVEKEGEDYNYSQFMNDIDTIIVGRKTHNYVLNTIGATHYDDGQRDVYVITRTARANMGRTIYYTGDLYELINRLTSSDGKHIYCDGGSEVINALLRRGLVDEFIISVIPVLLGNGIKLFQGGFAEQKLQLIAAETFDSGLVQLRYLKI